MAAPAIFDLSGAGKEAPAPLLASSSREPSTDPAAPDHPSQPGPQAKFGPASVRAVSHPQAGSDHPACSHSAGPFLAPTAKHPGPVQALPRPAAPPAAPRQKNAPEQNRHTELRRCEDLFFAFTFDELVHRTSVLIGRDSEYGDAYAYRCFARLAQIETHVIREEDYDLVHQLRDYFSACERPLATEGATVCRLFLKLVFGDLVKRIAGAQHDLKFALEKKEPLCGGAFAVLVGDFGKARVHFDAAASDAGSRSYAMAGIGLLKILNADTRGAIGAFAGAGIADEDILTLSGLLNY